MNLSSIPLEVVREQVGTGRSIREIFNFLKSYHNLNVSLTSFRNYLADKNIKKETLLNRSKAWIAEIIPLTHASSTNQEILMFLKMKYNEIISSKSLDRVLKHYEIKKSVTLPQPIVNAIVLHEMDIRGVTAGYRKQTTHVRSKYRVNIKRDQFMIAHRQLDPTSVQQRKANKLIRRKYKNSGPNDVWHLDGYDKLIKYGFGIHACIDGFSRMVIWLNVAPTNRLKALVGRYYLDATVKFATIPHKTRADYGGENNTVASIQRSIHGQHGHLSGQSKYNTRIESW